MVFRHWKGNKAGYGILNMTKNDNKITTQQVYELVNETRKELSSSILRLETKFDTLEAGRVSALEKDFANLQGKMAIVAAVVSFAIGIFFIVVKEFLK